MVISRLSPPDKLSIDKLNVFKNVPPSFIISPSISSYAPPVKLKIRVKSILNHEEGKSQTEKFLLNQDPTRYLIGS